MRSVVVLLVEISMVRFVEKRRRLCEAFPERAADIQWETGMTAAGRMEALEAVGVMDAREASRWLERVRQALDDVDTSALDEGTRAEKQERAEQHSRRAATRAGPGVPLCFRAIGRRSGRRVRATVGGRMAGLPELSTWIEITIAALSGGSDRRRPELPRPRPRRRPAVVAVNS